MRYPTIATRAHAAIAVSLCAALGFLSSCGDDEEKPSSGWGGGAGTGGSSAGSAGSAGAPEGGLGGSAGAAGEAGAQAGGAAGSSGSGSAGSGAVNCVANAAVHVQNACATTLDGGLYCWGANFLGQVGDGTDNGKSCNLLACVPKPGPVTVLQGAVQSFTVGRGFACATKADESLWCWGSGQTGTLGDGTFGEGNCACALTASQVEGGTTVASVAADYDHACARKQDGSLWCWGLNAAGQLGDGTMEGQACVGDSTTCRPLPVAVASLGLEVAQHTSRCALKTDGTLWCWGKNTDGQVGDGTNDDQPTPVQVEPLGLEVAQVATGADHTCAVKKDGTLWCWGNNSMTQLGEGPTDFSPVPLQVTALGATVAQVAAGNAHTCAVTQAGELYCWGANSAGQLGNGETGSVVWPPAKVAALGNDVTAVFAAPSFTCARTKDATLWCWGQNSFGQLGDGTTADRATPGKVLIPCP